jgi:hypothetical protein
MGRVSCQRQGPSVRTIIVRRSTLKTRRRFWMRFCYAEAIEEPLRVFVWRSRNVSAGSDAPLPAPILPGHLLWARPVQPFQASGPPGEESMPIQRCWGFGSGFGNMCWSGIFPRRPCPAQRAETQHRKYELAFSWILISVAFTSHLLLRAARTVAHNSG